MTIHSQFERVLQQLSEATRKSGISDRMGTVEEVAQAGGEQKIRVQVGVKPDGSPLISPWINPTAHHSGASTQQMQYKKGQNVRLSAPDGDYRQATVTAAPEGKHAPQPKNAPKHGYGNSAQIGGKLFKGEWGPQEQDQQSGGGQGGGGGGQQGGQQGGGDKNHRNETWIATEDHSPPKHSGKAQKMNGEGGGQDQQGGQQQQEKELKEAVMVSTDEKMGHTARVGKDVRMAVHEKGSKMTAGKTFFSAEKDKDAVMRSAKKAYVTSGDDLYVSVGAIPYTNKPWRLGNKPGEDNIPNDNQLGNSNGRGANKYSGGSGGSGGSGSA